MGFREQLEMLLDRQLGSSASKKQRADATGLDYDYYVMIAAGKKNPPSDDKIIDITKKLKLTTEETSELLILAAKDRAREPETKNAWSHIFNAPANGTPFVMPQTNYHTVPVWSSVQAGTGQLSEKSAEVVDEVLLTADEYKAKCFAIQITGDSMEPEIKDGDIGVFEPPDGLQPAENDVVAVELEGYGQWMIKRLKITGPNKVELISTNKAHPPIKVNIDAEKLEVKGILLRTVRKFKKRLFLK